MSSRANHGRISHSQARGSNAWANRRPSASGSPAFPAPSKAFTLALLSSDAIRLSQYVVIRIYIIYYYTHIPAMIPAPTPLSPSSFYGFLFSIPGQPEGLGQMQR